MIEEGIVKDLSMVVENAKLMGCQEVKSFKNIPLKNVEAVISALQKQIAKKPEDERCFIKDKENIGLCPSCGEGVNSNYPYCGHCGQRIKWNIEWSMETEE